jgi:hypothetical protein
MFYFPHTTVVDEPHCSISATGRNNYCFDLFAYPSAPHVLEPIDFLTIEASQPRGSTKSLNY